jgi:hypothetical protein
MMLSGFFRYLRGTSNAYLQFGRTREGLVCYVDSDYAANLDRRRSLTGYVFIVGDVLSVEELVYSL